MTDIENAKANLNGHSICLCRGGDIIVDDGRGISPMIRLIKEGTDLTGYSAADIIVGKAAALLFLKAGIAEVYGKVMSASAKNILSENGVSCSFDTLTDRIINRAGKDICPMEKTVADIDLPEEAFDALCRRLEELKGSSHK